MQASPVPTNRIRTRWGRSRFGGGSLLLVLVSIGLGIVVSSGIGWLAKASQPAQERPWLLFLAVAVVTLPVTTVGAWALLVDRSTLAGAIDEPEETVENRWYEKAATTTFHFLLATLGIGLAVFSFLRVDIAPPVVVGGYLVVGIAVFAASYLIAKRRDS